MNIHALKAKMAEQSVTQEKVAKALGCTQAAVSQKFTYERRLRVDEAAVIANLLGLTNDEIVLIFFE